MQKFLSLFDIHVGWEYRNIRGERKIVPTHNQKAIDIALEFARDFRPDIVLFGGDQINCAPISHWNANEPGLIGTFTLRDELEYFNDVVLGGLRSKKRVKKIWHRGNHEGWFEDVLVKHPGLRGLASLEDYLQLSKRGFEVYDYGEVSNIGKLRFMHGDTIPGGVNVAKTAAVRYMTNIRFGHFHTLQAYTLHNPVDALDVKTSICVPCLADKGPAYGANAPNQWVNGFEYGWVQESGDFTDYIAVIANNQVTVEGRQYGA